MAVFLRLVLCLTALVIYSQQIEGKPFFDGDFWCDLFCDDDDYTDSSVSTTTSMEDLFDSFFMDCNSCRPRRRSTTTSTTANPMQQGFNLNIPPSPVGMNLTMQNTGSSWLLNMIPWLPGGTPMPPPAAAPAAAPAAPAAATPAAADNATTAAPPAAK